MALPQGVMGLNNWKILKNLFLQNHLAQMYEIWGPLSMEIGSRGYIAGPHSAIGRAPDS